MTMEQFIGALIDRYEAEEEDDYFDDDEEENS